MPFDLTDGGPVSSLGATSPAKHQSLYSQPVPWSSKENVIAPLQQCKPIDIDYNGPAEAISSLELVATENQCLNKMVVVFVQLCVEVRHLMEEGEVLLINCLYADDDLCLLYGDEDELNLSIKTSGDADLGTLTQAAISKINKLLEFLCQTQYFVERCLVVISDIIKQLAALFAAEDQYYISVNYSSLHFQVIIMNDDYLYFFND